MSEPTFDLPELSENLVTIIAPLGDEPNVDDGLSAQQLRNKFDEGGKNIRAFLNNTLSPAIKNFLRGLNVAIGNLNTSLTTEYRKAEAQDEIDSDIAGDVSDLQDAVDSTADMLGIVINGNSTPVGASAGQYVIVKNSTISGITDGLYTAAQAIPANTAIDATYLTAVSGGGLNDLESSLTGDSTWTTLNSTYPTKYRKVAGIVFVEMLLTGGGTPPSPTQLGTLPVGYRPPFEISACTQNGRGILFISDSGYVGIQVNPVVGEMNSYMKVIVSFPA